MPIANKHRNPSRKPIRIKNETTPRLRGIGAAMRATRFVGRIVLNSLPNPFEENVELGQFEVAPGKGVRLTAHLLEITIA